MRCAPPSSVWTTIVMRETPGCLAVADRQRMDIEPAPSEQRRDAVQDARTIFDVNGESMHLM